MTLLIMDEDGKFIQSQLSRKIMEIPVDIKFNPGGSEKENDFLKKVSIKNVKVED